MDPSGRRHQVLYVHKQRMVRGGTGYVGPGGACRDRTRCRGVAWRGWRPVLAADEHKTVTRAGRYEPPVSPASPASRQPHRGERVGRKKGDLCVGLVPSLPLGRNLNFPRGFSIPPPRGGPMSSRQSPNVDEYERTPLQNAFRRLHGARHN